MLAFYSTHLTVFILSHLLFSSLGVATIALSQLNSLPFPHLQHNLHCYSPSILQFSCFALLLLFANSLPHSTLATLAYRYHCCNLKFIEITFHTYCTLLPTPRTRHTTHPLDYILSTVLNPANDTPALLIISPQSPFISSIHSHFSLAHNTPSPCTLQFHVSHSYFSLPLSFALISCSLHCPSLCADNQLYSSCMLPLRIHCEFTMVYPLQSQFH